jgi:Ca-activated chloride channel family protein
MQNLRFILTALVAGVLSVPLGAMSPPPEFPGEIALRGTLSQRCIPHRGATVFLSMEIDASGLPQPDRACRPMNIAVVLDRSGSMGDERKLIYAKQAVADLIDRLTPADYLSIVLYDERIETLFPTQHVRDRAVVKRLVEGVVPRGSTNLGGGMQEGLRQIERSFRREYVNRVILLSDGLANRGITDPRELDGIARAYRNRGISLSSMGVGLDYDENLMLGLAQQGGGNYYFIESPSQIASILERELDGLNDILLQNASIELTLGEEVTLADVIGCEHRLDGNRCIIPVGDVSARDRRMITVELNVPEGSGTRLVASGTLSYDGTGAYRCRGFSVKIRYTDVTSELEKGKDWETQANVDLALSTREVQRAMKAFDEGRPGEAALQLDAAATALRSSPSLFRGGASAPALEMQVRQLERYSRDVRDSSADRRKTKKSIQYDNYLMQKHDR